MTDTSEGPIFRASKRRKVFRKRPDDDTDGGDVATATAAMPTGNVEEAPDSETRESAAALKQRRLLGARKRGVGFSTSETRRPGGGGDSGTSSVHDTNAPGTPLDAVEARFVAPTGHMASAHDKHMMAYVDSKLARLHSATRTNETPTSSAHTAAPSSDKAASTGAQNTNLPSVTHGHLEEVDLASSSAAPTALTHTRLQPPKRPRKDRYRRNSADLARDAMVDQILRESQLNHYSSLPSSTPVGHNEDADERMAKEFERNFYAAAEERAVRKPALPPGVAVGVKGAAMTGPKLGGSRSQRAAMHAAEKVKAKK